MNDASSDKAESAAAESCTTPPRVVVLGHADRTDLHEHFRDLMPRIEAYATVVLADFNGSQSLADVEADLVIVLGGDGSILRAARQLGDNQIPVLGVNLGKLGFLADVQPDRFEQGLANYCSGNYRINHHLMFECSVQRDTEIVAATRGLNETAILAGPPYSLLEVELYIDAELVTTYSCDGLIVSTPVGSTAHSLSAGGPILRKDLQAFVICPISPHTLTVRPIVDSADREFELVVRRPHDDTSVVVDGQVLHKLEGRDRVRIRRATAQFRLIEVPGHGYYQTLREKLGWSGNFPAREKGT